VSFGAILAFLVLVAALIAAVFRVSAPEWLPYVLDAMLALAILLSPFPVRWPVQS
jgi:hypothetical protein